MAKRQSKRGTSGVASPEISPKYKRALEAARKAITGARVWRPVAVGDAVAGVIIAHTWRQGTERPYCSVTIDTGNEAILCRLGTIMLRTFCEMAIRVGAEVGLEYKGTVPSSHGAGRPATMIAVAETVKGKGEVIVTPDDLAAQEASRGRSTSRARAAKKGTKKGTKK